MLAQSRLSDMTTQMAIHDFNAQRLYLDQPLAAGGEVALSREQANYLLNVLRMGDGDGLLVFNGRDGEWQSTLRVAGKRVQVLKIGARTREQAGPMPIVYAFAPLKRARLDYMVQKAVEMGAGRLSPVLTRRTVAERVNLERMRANAIEAAEQCGILSLPEIDAPQPLAGFVAAWDAAVPLVFCDEGADVGTPIAALAGLAQPAALRRSRGLAAAGLLIGPEGGFDESERALLRRQPFVTAISLGPRVMRADTAAVAALAILQAVLGDWVA